MRGKTEAVTISQSVIKALNRDDGFWRWFRSDRFKAISGIFEGRRMVELKATFYAGLNEGERRAKSNHQHHYRQRLITTMRLADSERVNALLAARCHELEVQLETIRLEREIEDGRLR